MIFYLCRGNELAPTQADAKKLDPDFVQIDIPTDKNGLMAFVNNLYQRELPEREENPPVVPLPPPPLPAREPVSIVFEDQWENFPLALKLHYAALAMEDARELLNDTRRTSP